MKYVLSRVSVFLLLTLLASGFTAQAQGPVSSRLEAMKVTRDAAGVEAFAPAGEVAPGDLLEYRLVYANTGSTGISQLTVNGPVPKGTAYLPNSAAAATRHTLRYSYDGGKTWVTTPPVREVRAADGQVRREPLPNEEITNIAWQVQEPLKAGSSQTYRYRVRVLAVPG
ncbi:hypothetical protein [Nevskia sp.]|uniref:hypothetical protein n=1 Tax=Nevskia sp. TaxID=1929292 RepID=UPI0025FD7E83|nr:hypothetical protein [Nevskia sp.]